MRTAAPISVVIPAYNAAKTLRSTLDSVHAQTLQPLEIIVFDDGSADETAAVAQAAGATVIRSRNVGISRARNAAMNSASGEWVALLDADDLWHPRKLELQYGLSLRAPHLDLIACDFDSVTLGSVDVADVICQLRQYASIVPIRLSEIDGACDPETLPRLLPAWGIFLPSAVLVRRAFALGIGGFDPNTLEEDTEFFLRCAAAGRAGIVEAPLVGYVQNPSGIMGTRSSAKYDLDLYERVLTRPQVYHPSTVEALRDALPGLVLRIVAASVVKRSPEEAMLGVRAMIKHRPSLDAVVASFVRFAARSERCASFLGANTYAARIMASRPGRDAAHLQMRNPSFKAPWRAVPSAMPDGPAPISFADV